MSPAPGRGEDKVHTSLTVAPVVGWGQTSGLTAAPPTNTSYSGQQVEAPCSLELPLGLPKMTKQNNSPLKKLQEVAIANEFIKNNLSNIMEQEFRIIVIKLIAGLEKSIEEKRESIATEMRGLKNSHEELKNTINEAK